MKYGQQRLAAGRKNFIFFLCPLDGEQFRAAFFLFFFFFFFAVLALVVVCAVFFYISLYHVYKSCNPDTCVVFLILSIVFSVTVPFFLVADRNLDLGMPPRRTQAPEPLPESGQETDPYESL